MPVLQGEEKKEKPHAEAPVSNDVAKAEPEGTVDNLSSKEMKAENNIKEDAADRIKNAEEKKVVIESETAERAKKEEDKKMPQIKKQEETKKRKEGVSKEAKDIIQKKLKSELGKRLCVLYISFGICLALFLIYVVVYYAKSR